MADEEDMTQLGITDFVLIGLMLCVSASVGIYFRFTGGRQKTTQEFLMAGKNMHIGPVAFSLMATYMSAISVLGVPSETYLYGTQFVIKKAQKALFLSLPLILFFNFFTFWDGVVIYALFHDCDPMLDQKVNLESPDQLMPLAIVRMFGKIPGLSGLCIAGVFSASLSTVSSAVNSMTAVTMEDFIRPYCFCKCLSESWMAFVAKIIAVGYGVLTLLVTFIVANFRGVIEASNIMFGMVGGPVLGIYVLGMFTRTANEQGTLIGLIAGFIINAWLGFGSYFAKAPIETLPQSTIGCNASSSEPLVFVNDTADVVFRSMEAIGLVQQEVNYILPVYKMSFMWFPAVGGISVVIVGYLASLVIGLCTRVPDVDPMCLSPFVRKLFSKPQSSIELHKAVFNEVEMAEMDNKHSAASNGHTNLAMIKT